MAENERICDYCEEESKDMGMVTFPNGLAVCDICFDNQISEMDAESFNADSTPRFIPVEVMPYDEWWVRRFGRKYNPQDLGNAYNMSYVVLVRDIVIAEFDTQKEAENHYQTVRTAISVLGGVTPSKIDHPLALKEMDGYKDKGIRGGMNMAETFNAENSDMDKKALVESEVSIKMNELFEFVNYHVDAEDGAGGDLYGGLDDIEEAVSDYFIGYWDFESRHISNNPRYQNAETFNAEQGDTWTLSIASKTDAAKNGRQPYCNACDRGLQGSSKVYINESNNVVECAECYNELYGAETFNSYKVAPALSSYTKEELISSKAGPQGSASYDEMVYDPIAQDRLSVESFNAQSGGASWELFDRKTKAREGNYKSYLDALEAWEVKVIDEYPARVSENEWIVVDEVHHDEYGAETLNAKYEVIQEMHDGFQQHIASANSKSEAQEVVDTFPHKYRHFGKLKIVKNAESFNAESCVSCETPDWYWVGGLCSDSGELKCIGCCSCNDCHKRWSQLESGETDSNRQISSFSIDQKFHDAETFASDEDRRLKAFAKKIENEKKKLVKKAKRSGLYENFGQKEVRKLEGSISDLDYYEKQKYQEMIRDFDDWANSIDLRGLERYAETFASETPSTLKSMGYVAGTIGVGYLIFQRFVKDRLDETMNQ